uniref:Uncharacterized protein n=1 Tax=Trichobilharzia regenti TaxID=157069 RepID=A0AA85K039_TRIRE|nr:unnamed protein product [Trichobilharzia regenti]
MKTPLFIIRKYHQKSRNSKANSLLEQPSSILCTNDIIKKRPATTTNTSTDMTSTYDTTTSSTRLKNTWVNTMNQYEYNIKSRLSAVTKSYHGDHHQQNSKYINEIQSTINLKSIKHHKTLHYNSNLITLCHLDMNDNNVININQSQYPNSSIILPCIYVEVSLYRDLDYVASPIYLNHMEARLIFTLLERKLREAVTNNSLTEKLNEINTSLGNSSKCIKDNKGDEDNDMSSFNDIDNVNVIYTRNEKGSLEKRIIKNYGDDINHPITYYNRSISTQTCLHLFPKTKHTNSTDVKVLSTYQKIFNGSYVFTSGPKHVKPPKQWWDHINKVKVQPEFRCVTAWKLEQLDLIVGGLINYEHHLQLIVSSNNGKIGIVYAQALSLLMDIIQKGIGYLSSPAVNSKSLKCKSDGRGISFRIYLISPELIRLLASNIEDMSYTVGLNNLQLGICLLIKPFNYEYIASLSNGDISSDHSEAEKYPVLLYTKPNIDSIDQDYLRHITEGIRRLRILCAELMNSSNLLGCYDVMAVESLNYLVNLLNQSNLETENKVSLTKKYLTKSLIDELSEKVTDFHSTLAHCIRINAYYPTMPYPYATDPQVYSTFEKLFKPIIMEYYSMKQLYHPLQSDYTLPCHKPIINNHCKIKSYRIQFTRNITGYGFLPMLSLNELKTIENICKNVLLSWKEQGIGKWYPLDEFQDKHPRLYTSLLKKNLILLTNDHISQITGAYRYWPQGRSLYIAPKSSTDIDLVVQINAKEHLRIICCDWSGKYPYKMYKCATQLMQWLDSRLNFSRHKNLGYLNPCLWDIGCAMQISARIRLTNLHKNKKDLTKLCNENELNVQNDNCISIATNATTNSSDNNNSYYYQCCHLVNDKCQRVHSSPSLISSLSTSSAHILHFESCKTLGRNESQVMCSFLRSIDKICEYDNRYSNPLKLPKIMKDIFSSRFKVK